MPEDYRKVVLAAYKEKKLDGSLSPNLADPKPGDLQKECLIVYRERLRTSKDDEILRQFFGPTDQEKGYFNVLENSSSEKFKQMPKILKGKVPNPGIKFIELLAWLIDFQPRTSISYYNSFDKHEAKDIIEKPDVRIDETQNESTGNNDGGEHKLENEGGKETKEPIEEPVGPNATESTGDLENEEVGTTIKEVEVLEPSENPVYESRFSPRYITITCILLLFISSASFMAWENSPTAVRMPNSGENSMYWDGDHYEPIKDGDQKAGVTIIPLDLKLLQQQRKITLPDTLTSYSLGKVWYKGFVKNHEFFTYSDTDPIDTARRLKPLSNTILTKYTSNYRYLLTRLVWFLCAAFLISLCGYWAGTLKKEVKLKDQPQETDSTETLSLSETIQTIDKTELNPA